jgi:hypothetical protein
MNSSTVFKILRDISEKHSDIIQKFDKQILKSTRTSVEAKEAARLSLCRAGEKISLNGPGGEGWTVTVPDPKDERCPNCLSYDKWQYRELESYSPIKNIFFFRCTDVNVDGECQGRCEVKEFYGE